MSTLSATLEHNGTTYDAKIAVVERTMLGVEDHGIFTAHVHLTGINRGWGQAAGGYALDDYDKASKKRIGTEFGMAHIMAIIETLACRDWEHVTGSKVLALREHSRYGQLLGIADLSGERVLIFAEHAAQYRTEDVSS